MRDVFNDMHLYVYDHERKRTLSVYWCKENMFLPERFESKKTSPHHNGKVCAAGDHCPHTRKPPGLLNMVQVCVTTGVRSISFSPGPGGGQV